MSLSIFNSFSKLKLSRVAERHFASTIVMIRRIKKLNDALQKMVIDRDWKYLKKDEEKAQFIKECVVNDE